MVLSLPFHFSHSYLLVFAQESVELPLTHPEYYEEMGIKPPKGVILYGAPGTGLTAVIHFRVDYANSVIHGSINVRRLQCVQNSAARVVLRDRPHQSTTALLSELHWLPVQSRITFKIACLTYKVLTTGQPYYLRSLFHYYTTHHTYAQLINAFWSNHGFLLNLANDPSVIFHLKRGTVYPSN